MTGPSVGAQLQRSNSCATHAASVGDGGSARAQPPWAASPSGRPSSESACRQRTRGAGDSGRGAGGRGRGAG
eukprot:5432489-Pleurochrysis_carterae.AAC.1